LMVEAAAALSYPASRADVVAWFAEHYPDVKASTVRAHIVGLTANDRSRHHYAWLAKRDALFQRTESGMLTALDVAEGAAFDDEELVEMEEGAPPLEFALEAFLEEFLLTNWEGIDWGRPLELWESETGDTGEIGHQLVTPVGRLDFLCRDTATDALVVIELKRGRPSDRVVGQTARYIGWVRAELARQDQKVEGLIVAHEQDPQLYYAVSAVPDLSILTYSIDFSLSAPERPT
jgi:endonuclease NucS-like protein